jgi:hypothetical protein
MAIELGKYLKSPLLDQVQENYDELIQGQGFTHKGKTYLVEMIETSVDEKDALVIIARSANRVFGEIFYADETSEFIKTISHVDCPPQLRTIIKVGKRADAEKVDYVGEELNARQQVLLNLFKEEEELPLPSDEGYSRNQKAFALLVSALFLSVVAYGANKVRKGDITLPTRKEIGDFLSKTKANASDYLSQLRQKWMPQKGVKA